MSPETNEFGMIIKAAKMKKGLQLAKSSMAANQGETRKDMRGCGMEMAKEGNGAVVANNPQFGWIPPKQAE